MCTLASDGMLTDEQLCQRLGIQQGLGQVFVFWGCKVELWGGVGALTAVDTAL